MSEFQSPEEQDSVEALREHQRWLDTRIPSAPHPNARPEMSETTHGLKIWPEHFEAVVSGRKTFEVRADDREYAEGDTLLLREWNPDIKAYTGRTTQRRVSHLLRDSAFVRDGFVILSLAAPLAAERGERSAQISEADIDIAEYAFLRNLTPLGTPDLSKPIKLTPAMVRYGLSFALRSLALASRPAVPAEVQVVVARFEVALREFITVTDAYPNTAAHADATFKALAAAQTLLAHLSRERGE